MRKKTKITIDPKYILAVIAVVSILMIVVSFRFNDKMAPVQSAVGGVITPMQRGINTIGRKIAKQTKHITTMNKLLKQNDALKKKLDEMSAENRLLQQDKYELEDFRKLYKLDEQYASYPKVAARVISSDPDNWYNTFIMIKDRKMDWPLI